MCSLFNTNIIVTNITILLLIQGLGVKSWQLFFPSHLNEDTTKKEYVPANIPLLVRRYSSRGQCALLL